MYSISWSHDGKVIASNYGDKVALSDAQSGKQVGTIEGFDGDVFALDYATDGRLATSSADGLIRVWQIG